MAYVKAAVREEQIVAAAVEVLSDVGVAAMTLRSVAAQAGVPLGTMHYVFPSKDALLRAVISSVTTDIAEALRSAPVLDQGVAEALRRGITRFWDELVDGGIGLQLMQYELASYSIRSEGPGGLARLQYASYTEVVMEFCAQAAETAGEELAVGYDELGRLALALIDGLILQYVAEPDSERAHADLRNAIDMLIRFADPQKTTAP